MRVSKQEHTRWTDDDHLQTAEKPFKTTFGPLQANLGWQVLFAQPIDLN